MRFKVYLLRHRGRRLSWRDVHNGPHHVGQLLTHRVTMGGESVKVTTLQADDPMAPPALAPLYEAILLGFAPLAFRLRGFERVERGSESYACVQEWHCELPG